MNQRITIKHLERKADLLNEITGSPAVPYTRTEGGELVASVAQEGLMRPIKGR